MAVALEAETNVHWQSSSKERDEVKFIESVSLAKSEISVFVSSFETKDKNVIPGQV